MARTADVVIGANYGDEGKGLMTDYLTSREPGTVVVRFNGGCQAGHTVATPDGRRHVFSHFGSGCFTNAPTYLSRYFAVNPLLYLKERTALLATLQRRPTLYVDARAPVTTPYEMLLNQLVEEYRGGARHGSCGMGFGETIGREETRRFSLTVADLQDSFHLEAKLRRLRDTHFPARCEALGVPLDFVEKRHPGLLQAEGLVMGFLRATAEFLGDASIVADSQALLGQSPAIIMEGAQGLLLDQAKGNYPHVTRSYTGLCNALHVAEEARLEFLGAVYVTRAYLTRHGAGPLENELATLPYPAIEDLTNKPNHYQGAMRFAYLDHSRLARSIQSDMEEATFSSVCCQAQLAVTCLDQVGPKASFWKDGQLLSGSLERQLEDLDSTVLPIGYRSWGPTRATVEAGSLRQRAA